MPTPPNLSGLRDNHTRGTVADFLRAKAQPGSRLSIVSAYFTIYAYDALKAELDRIEHLDFLFGEPSFVNRLEPSRTEPKSFLIDADGLQLAHRLQQKRVARDCAEWIARKVDIRTIRQSNLLHGKMYHLATAGVEDAILGSSNFTVHGLGLGAAGNNIELNLIVDSSRDRQELKQWFTEVWNNDALVKDVRADVLLYLRKLYANQSPQFIYYLTLFHLFRDDLDGTRDLDDSLRRVALPDTRIWRTLYSFQKDGAKAAINKILDYDTLTPDQFEDLDFDEEDFTIGGRRRIHLGHLKLPEWLKAVRNDRTQLQFLLEKTQSVTARRDGKLAELKKLIEAKVRQPTANRDGKPNRKLLVFTAFADTARYLHEHLGPWARQELKIHTGLVCGDGGNAASLGRTDYDDILTNFSLDEFRLDLLRYLEANRAELEAAGEGLYAVVPPKEDLLVRAWPGALFCLRHRPTARKSSVPSGKPAEAAKLNPLAPYYLVYVHDDGTVRYSFAQPKETMLLLRDLAAGEPAAFEKLCELFDQRTRDSADMSHYDGLLRKALASIEHTFQRRAATSLLAGRGAVLPTAAEAPTSSGDDFDIVTWLVILEPAS